MNNTCPKCGEKLSVFYLKQNCPKCGVNLVYYNMEERLIKDSENADAEWEKVFSLIDKITPKFIKKKRAEKEARENLTEENEDEKTN